MAVTLSRQALYDLVWSRPRTVLAKEFGVSDVAIRKHCVRENIPAPPPGYWAKLKTEHKPRQVPLPIRLPGQDCWVVIGQDSRWYWRRASQVEPLVRPTFTEELEQQVQSAAKRIGKVPRTRDLTGADPALSRILASEEKLRAKGKEWSFYTPRFDSPAHQRQLRIFNSLARALRPLYGPQLVGTEEEWIQGVGTIHHLHLHLSFGGISMKLRFREPTDHKRLRGWTQVKATTLEVSQKESYGGVKQWSDSDDKKLEAQLTEIVACLLRRAEESFRAAALDHYEREVKQQEADRLEKEARTRAEEERRQAAVAAKRAQVRDEIVAMAQRRTVANEIRAMVAELGAHPAATGADSGRFLEWAAHALTVANAMDPMNATVAQLLGSFEEMVK